MREDTREMLLADGWEERFSASGARLAEMVDYYRELGFEVRVEGMVDTAEGEECAVCLGTAGADGPVGVVFTRMPTGCPSADEEDREA